MCLKRLLLSYRSHFGRAQKPAGSHPMAADRGRGFTMTGLLHAAPLLALRAHEGRQCSNTQQQSFA